jgi:hypothetical protein
MKWFEKTITLETALEFLDQLENTTAEFVINTLHENIHQWPFSNVYPKHEFDFKPEGAIVHINETPSLWNALHMLARQSHGAHFLILSGNRTYGNPGSRYPLVRSLPSTVLMLYPFDNITPHSGYLSTKTWGIELRSIGRLRPHNKFFTPPPILPIEEKTENFLYKDKNEEIKTYWKMDQWRTEFDGPTYLFDDVIYEQPTLKQVVSLITVLRVLNVIKKELYKTGPLNKSLIIPSNCIDGSYEKLPLLPWKFIRKWATDSTVGNISDETTIKEFFNRKNTCAYEKEELEWEDESLIAEQISTMRWRCNRDDGELLQLFEDRKFKMARGYIKELKRSGYDEENLNFAIRMWAIARRLGEAKDHEIYAQLNRESTLKNG